MRHHLALALAYLALTACAPAFLPTTTRTNGDVVILLTVNEAAYDVTLTVIGGTIDDDRCVVSEGDTVCLLGDLHARSRHTLTATGAAISCHATGFTRPTFDPRAARIYTCRAQG
ncbi:MAG: hypothetical protein H0U69_03550 [Trueperaceae bacterium]|nr:hypothetical protein [Trueperaceae bacterium]